VRTEKEYLSIVREERRRDRLTDKLSKTIVDDVVETRRTYVCCAPPPLLCHDLV
jgi:hypothetical protein